MQVFHYFLKGSGVEGKLSTLTSLCIKMHSVIQSYSNLYCLWLIHQGNHKINMIIMCCHLMPGSITRETRAAISGRLHYYKDQKKKCIDFLQQCASLVRTTYMHCLIKGLMTFFFIVKTPSLLKLAGKWLC